MWTTNIEILEGGRVQKHAVQRDGNAISYADAVASWQGDETFREFFISQLASAPFAAYFWETPAVTTATMTRHFEFVLVDSPTLAGRPAESQAFAAQFRDEGNADGIAAFENLGGDAYLVAPCATGPHKNYAHIAAFSRTAPAAQQHALWRKVGASVAQLVSTKPLWVSTSGLGVIWLHVRLDSRPKYYSYQPYRRGAPSGLDQGDVEDVGAGLKPAPTEFDAMMNGLTAYSLSPCRGCHRRRSRRRRSRALR